MNNKYFAIHKNQDDRYELWSDGCNNRDAALYQAELRILDTYGSRSKEYSYRINRLTAVNETEAKYLGIFLGEIKLNVVTPTTPQTMTRHYE